MTKTVTAAALEAAQNKLAEAQKIAAECRTNHADAMNKAADHRNEAAAHGDKAKAARVDFANAVRNGADQVTRAELRDSIADHEALAAHHEAEADRVAGTLPELQRLAEGGERFAGSVENEVVQAELADAIAEYRDVILPAIAPAVLRLHAAIKGNGGGSLAVDWTGTLGMNWTALPEVAGTLNGEKVWVTA
ncbi:hypothetical protein AWB75_07082 [Caballeronia catudaia]|uniref:Uncharacterized protein n=1 Tax=Caballeronia catudaia TaxID=1777136 RepID=A0A158DTS0_9BURK|nr:hypothetical protein [Caballeronia catudaia]SAK97117.1 hypothetical protein AWB75_07082 [Caballeronia catudaia]